MWQSFVIFYCSSFGVLGDKRVYRGESGHGGTRKGHRLGYHEGPVTEARVE